VSQDNRGGQDSQCLRHSKARPSGRTCKRAAEAWPLHTSTRISRIVFTSTTSRCGRNAWLRRASNDIHYGRWPVGRCFTTRNGRLACSISISAVSLLSTLCIIRTRFNVNSWCDGADPMHYSDTIRYIPPQTRRPTCDKMTKGEIFRYFRVLRGF
jgi:hypothetical protein